MRSVRTAVALCTVLAVGAVAGCSAGTTATSATASGTPQNLPLIANIKAADQVVLLEVARTAQQQDTGLMFRTDLPADRGMVFPVQPARVVSLWMKNTLIPLDMVFLRNGVVTKVDANVPICPADPCASYSSGTPVDQVIELKAGQAGVLGISPGTSLLVNSN